MAARCSPAEMAEARKRAALCCVLGDGDEVHGLVLLLLAERAAEQRWPKSQLHQPKWRRAGQGQQVARSTRAHRRREQRRRQAAKMMASGGGGQGGASGGCGGERGQQVHQPKCRRAAQDDQVAKSPALSEQQAEMLAVFAAESAGPDRGQRTRMGGAACAAAAREGEHAIAEQEPQPEEAVAMAAAARAAAAAAAEQVSMGEQMEVAGEPQVGAAEARRPAAAAAHKRMAVAAVGGPQAGGEGVSGSIDLTGGASTAGAGTAGGGVWETVGTARRRRAAGGGGGGGERFQAGIVRLGSTRGPRAPPTAAARATQKIYTAYQAAGGFVDCAGCGEPARAGRFCGAGGAICANS